jgi:hypothetical protein
MKTKPAQEPSPSVYLLQHVAREGSEDEDVKTLGIFSSRKKAEDAIRRFRTLAGFKRYPNGFYFSRFAVNQLQWLEGFVTQHPGR